MPIKPSSPIFLLTAFALGPSWPAQAEGLAQSPTGSGGLGAPEISRLRPLGQRFNAVETSEGELLFISGNGRYVVRGQAADLWHAEVIDSYDELEQLVDRVDLGRLGVDPKDLGALTLGNPSAPATLIFVDPLCPHCNTLLSDLMEADLLDAHRFEIVLLPVLGQASQAASMRLACLAEEDPQAATTALISNKGADVADPSPGSACGTETLQRALITAELIGVTGTPYLIAADGRTQRGAPADVVAWITETESMATLQPGD